MPTVITDLEKVKIVLAKPGSDVQFVLTQKDLIIQYTCIVEWAGTYFQPVIRLYLKCTLHVVGSCGVQLCWTEQIRSMHFN